MKSKALFLLAFFVVCAAACSAAPPSGNLSIDHSVIYPGDPVTIYVEASGDAGMKELYASYDGSWHRFDCAPAQTYCAGNWTWAPVAAGTYEIQGYVRDSADSGVATVPDKWELTVLAVVSSSTTAGTTTTTRPAASTSSLAPASTTSSSTSSTTTSVTTSTRPRDYLAVIGNFLNYTICAILGSIWALSAGLGALVLIFAGVRFMTSGDAVSREKVKSSVVQVFAALIVIFLTVPVINYFVSGTNVAQITCNLSAGPPITFTNVTLTPPSTTLPDDRCAIRGVYIGDFLFKCGASDGICPQRFNPTSGGCPPGSKTECNPVDPDR